MSKWYYQYPPMRIVIQRVSSAHVMIDGRINGRIGPGLMILVGVEDADDAEDVEWLCQKIVQLRIFEDEAGLMNLDIRAITGDILLVSQFTLHAAYRKGNRPSFVRAARPEQAIFLYRQMITRLTALLGKPVQTGIFGADMKVSLTNDGPVTIIMDSKNRE
jgi:D-tyrosyl-tRNA(Tyr) deacylase